MSKASSPSAPSHVSAVSTKLVAIFQAMNRLINLNDAPGYCELLKHEGSKRHASGTFIQCLALSLSVRGAWPQRPQAASSVSQVLMSDSHRCLGSWFPQTRMNAFRLCTVAMCLRVVNGETTHRTTSDNQLAAAAGLSYSVKSSACSMQAPRAPVKATGEASHAVAPS
jgi:hypothetical protein